MLSNQMWHQIFTALNKGKIDYVLVGAAALVVHGLPRSTVDIDIYIKAAENTIKKIFQVTAGLKLDSKQRHILKISHKPELLIGQWINFTDKGKDILDVYLAGEEEFNEIYKDSKKKKDKRLSLRVASLSAITKMKKASARAIDKADINLIKESRSVYK